MTIDYSFNIWIKITFYSDGPTRHNLSRLNKNFRCMITRLHISLLKKEQKRIQSFITDVESTTVNRFIDDFESLKIEWKPPDNNLMFHQVDYHYHLLSVTLEMLRNIELYHLFFYFTNNQTIKPNINLIKQLVHSFQYPSTNTLFEVLGSISQTKIQPTFLVNSRHENPLLLHQKIFNKWEFDVVVQINGWTKIILKGQPNESMLTRFFSNNDLSRRLHQTPGNVFGPHLPLDELKFRISTHYDRPPHFKRSIKFFLSYHYSPHLHEQIILLLRKENIFCDERVLESMKFRNNQTTLLTRLFQSDEWGFLKKVLPYSTLLNFFASLIDEQKLTSICHLFKNWPYLLTLFNAKNIETTVLYFDFLTTDQIDCIGNFLNSLQVKKKDFDECVSKIADCLKIIAEDEDMITLFTTNLLQHILNCFKNGQYVHIGKDSIKNIFDSFQKVNL